MPLLISPGLRLDHHGHAGGRNRDRVDITRPRPPQRMPQPPALGLEDGKRTLNLVLRARADTTAASQRDPAACVQAEPERDDQQAARERHRSGAGDHKRQQPGCWRCPTPRPRRGEAVGTAGGGRRWVTRRIRLGHSCDQASADAPITTGRSRTRDQRFTATRQLSARASGIPSPDCERGARRARPQLSPSSEDAPGNPHGVGRSVLMITGTVFPAPERFGTWSSTRSSSARSLIDLEQKCQGRCDLNATSSSAAHAESRSSSDTGGC